MKQHQEMIVHQCVCETCQQHPYSAMAKEHQAINRVLAGLDEKNRRRFVGLLALQLGPRQHPAPVRDQRYQPHDHQARSLRSAAR